MVSLNDVRAVYEDPSLLNSGDVEGKNFAFDVASKTRVIRLVDGRLKYDGNEIYVPGESYLISLREVERVVRLRRELKLNGVNIFPRLVDGVLAGKDFMELRLYNRLGSGNREEVGRWLHEGGLEEITSLADFCKVKKSVKEGDRKNLVLLKNLDPIIFVKGDYEYNGVYFSRGKLAGVSVPLEVEAYEAELGFVSESFVKITDGARGVGGYKEGILTLEKARFFIQGLEDKIKKKKTSNFDIDDAEQVSVGSWWRSLVSGSSIGSLVGLGVNTVTSLIPYSITHFFHLSEDWIVPYVFGGVGFGLMLGGTTGLIIGMEHRGRIVRGYDLEGNCMIKTAFYGIVKDKRFDDVKDLLVKDYQSRKDF